MSSRTQGTAQLSARANKLDLLERLADDLAHEIKNPLHSMVINLEVLKRRVARYAGPEQSDEMLRYIRVLDGELERVHKRIELLLRLARPGRGMELITLGELLDELVELIQLEAAHKEVAVRFGSTGTMVRVRVSRDVARQVILNLVLEVLDTLGPGGSLELRIEQQSDQAALVVQGCPAPARETLPSTDGNASPDADVRLGAARTLAETIGGSIDLLQVTEGSGSGISLSFSLPVASG